MIPAQIRVSSVAELTSPIILVPVVPKEYLLRCPPMDFPVAFDSFSVGIDILSFRKCGYNPFVPVSGYFRTTLLLWMVCHACRIPPLWVM